MNKEKFFSLVSKNQNDTLNRNKERIKNRAVNRESRKIALRILMKLDELCWSQKILAEKMNVTPQYISKIVSGKENFSLESLIKLQSILDIPILASYYVEDIQNIQVRLFTLEKRVERLEYIKAETGGTIADTPKIKIFAQFNEYQFTA